MGMRVIMINDYITGMGMGVHGNKSMGMGIELWERE